MRALGCTDVTVLVKTHHFQDGPEQCESVSLVPSVLLVVDWEPFLHAVQGLRVPTSIDTTTKLEDNQ